MEDNIIGYCAYVTTITQIRKHTNADRLQCVTIYGNNVIVGLDSKIGDKVIFFPTDGQLDYDFAESCDLLIKKDETGKNIGGYLDPNKRNIRPLNLRGEKSEGLVLPLSVLSAYTNIDKLKDGQEITVLDGKEICKKYIPRGKKSNRVQGAPKVKQQPKFKFPFFKEHSKTQQLAYNQGAIAEGELCYITLKMHGTSARTANSIKYEKVKQKWYEKLLKKKPKEKINYEYVTGSRRCVVDSFVEDKGFYGTNAFRKPYHDLFVGKLPQGMEVFYEIVGYVDNQTPIMNTCINSLTNDKEFITKYGDNTVFSYGCKEGESDIYVYRINVTSNDGYVFELPWDETVRWCEILGVKPVPTYDRFFYTTWEDLMERVEQFYDGVDPIGCTHIKEGVVVRVDSRSTFTAYKHKNFYFKLLEGIIKDNSDEPDMEEAEEFLVEEELATYDSFSDEDPFK